MIYLVQMQPMSIIILPVPVTSREAKIAKYRPMFAVRDSDVEYWVKGSILKRYDALSNAVVNHALSVGYRAVSVYKLG